MWIKSITLPKNFLQILSHWFNSVWILCSTERMRKILVILPLRDFSLWAFLHPNWLIIWPFIHVFITSQTWKPYWPPILRLIGLLGLKQFPLLFLLPKIISCVHKWDSCLWSTDLLIYKGSEFIPIFFPIFHVSQFFSPQIYFWGLLWFRDVCSGGEILLWLACYWSYAHLWKLSSCSFLRGYYGVLWGFEDRIVNLRHWRERFSHGVPLFLF